MIHENTTFNVQVIFKHKLHHALRDFALLVLELQMHESASLNLSAFASK